MINSSDGVFSVNEIRQYLESCADISGAIAGLSEQSIAACIPVDDFDSLNFVKNESSLERYEAAIGMEKQKNYQRVLYRNSDGKKGRYWTALSARWIEEQRGDTKYMIGYWVNYGDNNTYGWFTVEQIMRWFAEPELQLHELGGTKER